MGNLPVLLAEAEVCEILGCCRHHLYNMRKRGTGPRFFRLGAGKRRTLIRYDLEDVRAWLESRKQGEQGAP